MAVQVVGAGLAGSEAAWQIAQAGLEVTLWEMRPVQSTPAHHSPHFAELVCSNSFGAIASDRAAGLLKEELRRLGSVVIDTALAHAVPAGGALAVDRATFSAAVTERVSQHPKITVQRQELTALPDAPTVLCTGPLTSASLAAALQSLTGLDYLSFYDAASPIVTGESLDRDIAFLASRYDRGEAAYLNCPLNEAEYQAFWQALVTAEQAPLKDFEADRTFFEGCLPLEEMARRGEDTLRFGPLKPVGLIDPRTGQEPYACVQLRQEDRHGRLWNLVGFQTNLKWGEQQRVFRLIPGLAEAEFVRLGVMHRNTFLNAPQVIDATLQLRQVPHYFAAGQLVGTEGYACAVAGGWLAGINMARYLHGLPLWMLPPTTMMGALFNFVSTADAKHFQPMPANFGLLPNLDGKKVRRKQDRYGLYRDRALAALVPFGAVETPTISDVVSAVA